MSLIVAIAAFALSGAQKAPTLADYLAELRWDAAKRGPMVVLQPQKVSQVHLDESGFDSFDRMAVTCGALTAIVPTEMVLIDDSLKDEPNLYEGLSMKDKMTYLLSTLSADQWRIANAGGIGLSDLQGEQRAVVGQLLRGSEQGRDRPPDFKHRAPDAVRAPAATGGRPA